MPRRVQCSTENSYNLSVAHLSHGLWLQHCCGDNCSRQVNSSTKHLLFRLNKILTESEMYEMSENDHNLHSKKPLGVNGVNHGGNMFPQICNRHLENN